MQLLEAFPRLISWAVPIIILAIIVFPQAIRVLREYERAVIFRLGKLLGAKGPGVIFLIPIVDRMVRMDLRVVTIDVPRQEVMTRDNVPVSVDAVLYFRVIDPQSAVVKVENFLKATSRRRLKQTRIHRDEKSGQYWTHAYAQKHPCQDSIVLS